MNSRRMMVAITITFLLMIFSLIVLFASPIIIYSDSVFNALFKGTFFQIALSLFIVSIVFFSKNRYLLTASIKPGDLLWCIFPFSIALLNFPLSSLILGEAAIVYAEFIPLLLLYSLSGALAEELVFRVLMGTYFFNYIKQKKNAFIYTVLLTSILFALWHFVNLIYPYGILNALIHAGYFFLIGIVLAFTYYKIKNIWFTSLIHFFFRFGSTLIIYLGVGNIHDTAFWILSTTIWVIMGSIIIIKLIITNIKNNRYLY